MTRKKESRLRSQDIQALPWKELLDFTFERKSFFRDYKLLHAKGEENVKNRLKQTMSFMNPQELSEEIRLCFNAAILMDTRQTYHFNLFVIDLIERYHSDAIYYSKKEEIKNEHLIKESSPSISLEWVLCASTLNTYQRYLLFEYLALGYSIEDLASRRHCTSRTIHTHLKQIVEVLGS